MLAYHNVVPDGEGGRGDRALHVERSAFSAQLDDLLAETDVIPLRDMLTRSRRNGSRPRTAITFDDAYRGAVTIAVQELSRRSLPATIFVTPGLLGDRSFWWDDVAFGPRGPAGLSEVRPVAIDRLSGEDGAVRAWAEEHGIEVGLAPPAWRSATMKQLVSAAAVEGVTLAPHSWSHPNMAMLSDEDAEEELRRPLEWLREHFDEDLVLPWIAWPYGRHSDAVCRMAGEVGYQAGLRVDGTWLPDRVVDPFRLPRLSVSAGLSRDGFRARIAGAWMWA